MVQTMEKEVKKISGGKCGVIYLPKYLIGIKVIVQIPGDNHRLWNKKEIQDLINGTIYELQHPSHG
jgi:putative transposon-encoded protein